MKLVEINWNPTTRQLRQFGFIALAALPALGWLWSGGNWTIVAGLGALGLVLAGLAIVAPQGLKPVFLLFTIAAIPIGIVVGELAMLLIYFGVFLPISCVFRLTRRDSLQLRMDRNATTYWRPKAQPNGPASYFRQS
ncbi:MAG: hypothetical protein ACKV0T_22735 [Planctomycetales bacterium]